ncbi:hypothetical protein D3C85_1849070 [compost metagenome]
MAERTHFFNYLIALACKVYALYSPIIHIGTTLDEARRFQTINKPSQGGLARLKRSCQITLDHAVVT